MTESGSPLSIAVVGMGAIFPGRGDVTGFWRDLFEGRDLITSVPADHWLLEDYHSADPQAGDRTYGSRGGFISPVAFDPVAFGLPPKAMAATDPAQLLALIAAQMTFDDMVRDSAGKVDRSRTSVILGAASATELTGHMAGRMQRPAWVNAMRRAGLGESEVQSIADDIAAHFLDWQEATFPGMLGNVIAGRIANRFDLGGSNFVTDAACASSLSALQIAIHELQVGDSDTVLTGGVDALNDITTYMCFSKTPALSPTGDCRPFSSHADGTMLGEGIGMIALRRLEDAERDGNRIYALIRGMGGASDGKGTAIYSPLPHGQARALKRAYAQAGYGPEAVDLLEAHGTGTKAGDKAEIDGLHQVFSPLSKGKPWCAIGSVKSQIGHTKGAAGSASLIKAISALSRRVLPPTIKVEEPAETIKDSDAFYLNTEPRPWIAPVQRPRRAAVSSFGFGGSNFHVTLEEYSGARAVKPFRVLPAELFLFSADTAASVADAITQTGEALSDKALSSEASQSVATFDTDHAVRVSIVARSADDFREKAATLLAALNENAIGKKPLKAGCFAASGAAQPGPIAFLFSGQGSQYVGMGADLAMAFPAARRVWDEAAGDPATQGLALHRLAFPPAAFDQVEHGEQTKTLTEMQHAQPAIAAVALAQLALLDQAGLHPAMTGGHSFGEIMALHAGGVMNDRAALRIAMARGAIMADAARDTQGTMLAVQASADRVRKLAAAASVVIANDNGPSQTVLSGTLAAIEDAMRLCQSEGLKASKLNVATAFHSAIVAPAVKPFADVLSGEKLRKPLLPVYANATGKPYGSGTRSLAQDIAAQLASSVEFAAMIEAMYAAGARTFIEVGPGAIVKGLTDSILEGRDALTLSLDNKRVNGVEAFLSALGALSVAGYDIAYEQLFADLPAAPAPPVPPKHAVMINAANSAKPYPPKSGAAGRAPPNAARTAAPALQKPNPSPTPLAPTGPAMTNKPTFESPPMALPANERMLSDVARLHGDFLSAMTQAHSAFMQAAAQIATGTPNYQPAQIQMPPLLPAPTPVAAPQPVARAAQPPAPAPAVHIEKMQRAPAPMPAPKPAPAPVAAAKNTGAPDATTLVRQLIAEKTGYPEDMLDADMDLEGELGVDSIKQVEILSALRDRVPGLPEIDPERLVELRTIRAIAQMLAADAPATPAAAAPVMNGAAAHKPPAHTNGAAAGVDLNTVRALIAEKTGYPEDMLEPDMDLEGELGVDSIKQVEILSSLRDRFPELPEVDPEDLTRLRTIRLIADFFR